MHMLASLEWPPPSAGSVTGPLVRPEKNHRRTLALKPSPPAVPPSPRNSPSRRRGLRALDHAAAIHPNPRTDSPRVASHSASSRAPRERCRPLHAIVCKPRLSSDPSRVKRADHRRSGRSACADGLAADGIHIRISPARDVAVSTRRSPGRAGQKSTGPSCERAISVGDPSSSVQIRAVQSLDVVMTCRSSLPNCADVTLPRCCKVIGSASPPTAATLAVRSAEAVTTWVPSWLKRALTTAPFDAVLPIRVPAARPRRRGSVTRVLHSCHPRR